LREGEIEPETLRPERVEQCVEERGQHEQDRQLDRDVRREPRVVPGADRRSVRRTAQRDHRDGLDETAQAARVDPERVRVVGSAHEVLCAGLDRKGEQEGGLVSRAPDEHSIPPDAMPSDVARNPTLRPQVLRRAAAA